MDETTTTSNQQATLDLIRRLSGQANVITAPRIYVEILGSIEGAVFLSQLIYWSDRTKDPDGWFAKSYLEWQAEIALSKFQVARWSKLFADEGFLETKLAKWRGAPTVYYRLSISTFWKWIVKKLDNGLLRNFTMDCQETSQSYTKTTTEITPKSTDIKDDDDARARVNGRHAARVSRSSSSSGISRPDLESQFGERAVKMALEIAENAGKPGSLRYAAGVLRNWEREGTMPRKARGINPYDWEPVRETETNPDDWVSIDGSENEAGRG